MPLRDAVLEEIELIQRDGGEIPEVAYWNSRLYLEDDPEGPRLRLSPEEEKGLKQAVISRYLFIIRRDLTFDNIGKPFYRGLTRAAINWRRLKNFLLREDFPLEDARLQVLEYLRNFLSEVAAHLETLSLDLDEVRAFLEELGCPPEPFLATWYQPLRSQK